jgi:hypothetical protein
LTEIVVAAETDLAPTVVEDLLQVLVKALRAHQLYLPNNPVYQKSIENLRAAFAPVWAETRELNLDVYEADLRWAGQVVYSQPSRNESIAWIFFKDGVRSVSLLPGVEEEEIVGLLDVLRRARTLQAEDSDDMLTLLWEKDFQLIRYRFQDLVADSGGPDLPSQAEVEPVKPGARWVRGAMEEEVPPAARAGIVRADEFDTTLYFLDEKEVGFLKAEVEREYSQDLRLNVLSMVIDMLELQVYPTVRAELVSIIESFLPYLLGAGDFSSVAFILRECKVVLERARELLPEHRKALEDLPARLSQEETLSQLLQSLDEAHAHPQPEDLAELFGEFRGEALPTLFAWLPRLTNARVRDVLEVAVRSLAMAHVNRVVEAIGGKDPVMVGEAIALTGKLKLQQAVPALVSTLTHAESGVRQAAVQALSEIGSPGALQGLERALEDPDREVRLLTVRILAQRRHRGALSRITLLVQGKSVRHADLTEKMAFFEAYGAMVGEQGVEVLGGMLNSGGFLRKKEDPETRACAAMALGRIGSANAIAALNRAADAKEAIVRNAVNRALRVGTGTGA